MINYIPHKAMGWLINSFNGFDKLKDGLSCVQLITCVHFYLHGLTLIPAWISNHMPGKVWGDITYPFLNFNGCTVEV